jgi:hypothetical protein
LHKNFILAKSGCYIDHDLLLLLEHRLPMA